MSVDRRTRADGSEAAVEPAPFFDDVLPAMFPRARRAPFERALRLRSPRPLTVTVGADTWTLEVSDGAAHVTRCPAGTFPQLRLERSELWELVHDQATPNGWYTRGSLRSTTTLDHLLDWWLLIRGALDDTPPYVPGSIGFTDLSGDPLDLERTFHLGDPPSDITHFLHEAGFVRFATVFSPDEMAALSAEMDQMSARYRPGDGRSFWGTTTGGQSRLVRMQYFDAVSAVADELADDDRLAAIAALTGDGHELNREAGLVEALFKPTGMAGAIADFPWHKDCSLGRHSYECCSLTMGLAVTPADPERGVLRVLAGSHRALVWPVRSQPGLDLPVVDLVGETGDVTMHLSCTSHMSRAPSRGERRVLFVGWRLPEVDPASAAEARRRVGLRTADLT